MPQTEPWLQPLSHLTKPEEKLGPKLKEGDKQVPEGLCKVESLNPNNLYHLAPRANYPDVQNRLWGRRDVGENLGSDIMINGNACSIGCLAMGDDAAEDMFVLAAETGIKNISIILPPVDFRVQSMPDKMPPLPPWANSIMMRSK